jgi:hypothetical protein
MIKHFKGDAITALQQAQLNGNTNTYLVHCCNAQGVMGSGIAKSIKERIPRAYEEYKWHLEDRELCGVCPMGRISHGDNVINLIAQEGYGRGKRQVHYGYLAEALHWTATMFGSYEEECTLIVPYKMCCDRAGGDWDVVVELLEVTFEGWTIEVYAKA